MGAWGEAVPLTQLQTDIATLLASGRSPDSYLAGGAALHFEPNTLMRLTAIFDRAASYDPSFIRPPSA